MSTQHTTGSIAQAVQGRLAGPNDLPITDLAGLEKAGPSSLTFIRDRQYAARWVASKAGAALVTEGLELPFANGQPRAVIYVQDADLAMIRVLSLFERRQESPPVGVHPTAVVDESARVSPTARVGARCVVGPRTTISDGATLMPGVTLGADVVVGPGSVLYPGVVVYDRCTIGAQTVLHAGVVIGADGFGYHPTARGPAKIPHIGVVQIGNGVEIGANSCIDRGKFGATVIADGVKIDNLVQIGHNAEIGRGSIVCGNTGIAGSVVVGEGVIIGGHVGVADHLTIGPRARIGAKSGVMCDVPAGEAWTGLPAAPHREQMRTWSATKQVADLLHDFRELLAAAAAAGIKINSRTMGARRSRGFDRTE